MSSNKKPSAERTNQAQATAGAPGTTGDPNYEQQRLREQQLWALFNREGLRIVGAVTGAAGRAAERHEYGEMQNLTWLTQQLSECVPGLFANQFGGGETVIGGPAMTRAAGA